ncbi:hypothetical protein HHK36_011932 [Tetracentron sinense]|nr:hypothetical protein HHK36_011932 [Tetracentron sinense]
MRGLMSMHEHDIMTMFLDSSSSSSSIQAMAMSKQFNPLPLVENSYTMTCMGDGFYGGHGVLMGGNMGIEGDLLIPPLESINIEINAKTENPIDKNTNNSHFNNNNININNNNNKVESMVGVGNYWEGENLRMGEWDLGDLMEDVSSFPFLDFQVESPSHGPFHSFGH